MGRIRLRGFKRLGNTSRVASLIFPLIISGSTHETGPKFIKGSRSISWFPQPPYDSPQFPSPTSQTPGWCNLYLFFLTTLPITMFSKVALISLAVGVLSINALVIPVPRSPAPEPEREFSRSFSRPYPSYHDLIFVFSNSLVAA